VGKGSFDDPQAASHGSTPLMLMLRYCRLDEFCMADGSHGTSANTTSAGMPMCSAVSLPVAVTRRHEKLDSIRATATFLGENCD
jgi:hypothetical protein